MLGAVCPGVWSPLHKGGISELADGGVCQAGQLAYRSVARGDARGAASMADAASASSELAVGSRGLFRDERTRRWSVDGGRFIDDQREA